MSVRFFEDSQHVAAYAEFRPKPPPQLGNRIMEFLKAQYDGPLELCIDVGCGSGQCIPLYAQDFQQVLGTDISPAQIELARSFGYPPNTQFRVSAAESLEAENGSVQLINSSQACHWFNLPAFFEEVDRVLSSGGVLALSGYKRPQFFNCTKAAELNQHMDQFYHVELRDFFHPGNQSVYNEYRNIDIPYDDFVREEIWSDEMTVPLSAIIGELASFSGFQSFCRERGNEAGQVLLDQFVKKCQTILGTEQPPQRINLSLKRKYFLLMGRKVILQCNRAS